MSNFSSGVKRFIKARAVVEVGFPVDWHDRADIACKHCQFFVYATRKCALNGMVVNFPEKYVGEHCPLERVEVTEDV